MEGWRSNNSVQDGVLTLLGVDSTSFGPYKVKWASLTAPYDLESIEAELAPLAGHFRDRIANGLVTFFEFGNETWNWIFDGTHWLAAQSRAKFGRDDSNAMAGYLGAHCMKVIRDVYGIKNRNRWRGVLATQTVNPQVTKRRISGAIQYIREHAPSLMLNDLFNDLAIAGYFGGWMFKPKNKAMVDGWMDESESRSGAGLEPNKYSFFNRVVNEKLSREINRYPVNVWASQKTIADAHGLTLIQYEGGNGNKPGFFSVLTKAERVRFMEFYKHCNHTPEDAQNYTAIFNEFIAFGGKYPAKFVEMGAVGRYGAWGGLRYLGDKNPVWDAVVKFNGRT
jgi:hypothetical protein